MKKYILILITFFSLSVSAQKKDTTVQTTMTLDQFRVLLYTIDQNIDSKKTSKEIIDFIRSKTQIVADKPKEQKEPQK